MAAQLVGHHHPRHPPRAALLERQDSSRPDAISVFSQGDLVRVRSYEEILATLDTSLSNRGLKFDAELVPFCGKVFRVSTSRRPLRRRKRTVRCERMKTPAVILEGVNCKALYSGRRMFCPRGIHLWWREIWLERVSVDTRPRAPPLDPRGRTHNGRQGRIDRRRHRRRRTGTRFLVKA